MKKTILILFSLFSFSIGLGIVSARIPAVATSPCPSPIPSPSPPPSGPERPDHRCGPNFGESPCNPGRCCSIYEYCGTGAAYCQGGHCLYQCGTSPPPPPPSPSPSPPPYPGPERPDHRCGPNFGESPCNPGRCCSVYEYCGSGASYCQGGQCLYQCWTSPPPPSPGPTLPPPSPGPFLPPPGPSPLPPSGPERPDHRCGPAYGDSPCDTGRCCSVYGYCGSTFEFCQPGSCRSQCWIGSSPPPPPS